MMILMILMTHAEHVQNFEDNSLILYMTGSNSVVEHFLIPEDSFQQQVSRISYQQSGYFGADN